MFRMSCRTETRQVAGIAVRNGGTCTCQHGIGTPAPHSPYARHRNYITSHHFFASPPSTAQHCQAPPIIPIGDPLPPITASSRTALTKRTTQKNSCTIPFALHTHRRTAGVDLSTNTASPHFVHRPRSMAQKHRHELLTIPTTTIFQSKNRKCRFSGRFAVQLQPLQKMGSVLVHAAKASELDPANECQNFPSGKSLLSRSAK